MSHARPATPGSTVADCPPPRCDPHALTDAAELARRLYPGPVGRVLARDLESTRACGYMAPDGLTAELVEWLGDRAARLAGAR